MTLTQRRLSLHDHAKHRPCGAGLDAPRCGVRPTSLQRALLELSRECPTMHAQLARSFRDVEAGRRHRFVDHFPFVRLDRQLSTGGQKSCLATRSAGGSRTDSPRTRELDYAADQPFCAPKEFAVQGTEIRIRAEEAEPSAHTHRDSDHSLVCFDYETIHFGLLDDGSATRRQSQARAKPCVFLRSNPWLDDGRWPWVGRLRAGASPGRGGARCCCPDVLPNAGWRSSQTCLEHGLSRGKVKCGGRLRPGGSVNFSCRGL